MIRENVSTESLFHFAGISVSEMTKEPFSLNSKKAGLLKKSSDIYNKVLQKIWNSQILEKRPSKTIDL